MKTAFAALVSADNAVELRYRALLNENWNFGDTFWLMIEPLRGTSETPHASFLSGLVEFSRDGDYIGTAQFWGTYVHTPQTEALHETFRQNPDWTDNAVSDAVRHAGAKYGPGDRDVLLKDLNVDRFAPVLGAFKIVKTRFLWRMGVNHVPAEDVMAPLWSVEVRTNAGAKPPICYALGFEPFEGQLQILSGNECH